MRVVLAQDVPFNPRLDALEDKKPRRAKTPVVQEPVKHQAVYSYARFAVSFKVLCAALEADGRQVKVYQVSKTALGQEYGCSSCRALYRQLVNACQPPVPKIAGSKKKVTPVATVNVSPDEASEDEGGASEEVNEDGASATEMAPESSPTPGPNLGEAAIQPARYPRTDLVDAASRISVALYDIEPGNGSTFRALQNFEERLLASSQLTPGEKDYFGVMFSYLFSAWEGRPGSPLDPRVKAKEDVSVLFQ